MDRPRFESCDNLPKVSKSPDGKECSGHGKCQKNPPAMHGLEYSCICDSGWGGPYCEVNEDESWTEKIKEFCTGPDKRICSDNGACGLIDVDGTLGCICNEGWDGQYCDNEINPTNPYRCDVGAYYNEAQEKCLPCRKCWGALGGYEDPEFVAQMCDGSGNKNPTCMNRCPPNQYYTVIDENEHTCHKCHYARDANNEQVPGQQYCPTGHKVQPPGRRDVPGKAWRFIKCSGNTNRDVSSCAPTELYCDSEKCLPSWKLFDDFYPGSFKQPQISCPGAEYFDDRYQKQSGGQGVVGERGGWRGWFHGFSGNQPNIMDHRSIYEAENRPFIKSKKGNLLWDDTYSFNEYIVLEHDFFVPNTYFARCSLNWQNDAEPGTETQCFLKDWDGQGGSHLKRSCAAMGVDVNDIVTWPPGLTEDDNCNYHEPGDHGKFKCCDGWRLEYDQRGKAVMKEC